MTRQLEGRRRCRWQFAKFAAVGLLSLNVVSCAVSGRENAMRLKENARLVEEVKTFGKTLGIEPTEALSRTAQDSAPLSMLWVWMQRVGTLALAAPVDIRMAIGFGVPKEDLKLEQVYRVNGYSVYYRQGNEFADSRSIATAGFAGEGMVRRVEVILHEDLHGDANFALPWEVEESIVTPLGSLAAAAFFKSRRDHEYLKQALATLEEERELGRELNALAEEAEKLFKTLPIEEAHERILNLMPSYPVYYRQFRRQIADQHPPTVLEAKVSHDLAYYRYFDQIVGLSEKIGDLRTLISDLKKLPADAAPNETQAWLRQLETKYGQALKQ